MRKQTFTAWEEFIHLRIQFICNFSHNFTIVGREGEGMRYVMQRMQLFTIVIPIKYTYFNRCNTDEVADSLKNGSG